MRESSESSESLDPRQVQHALVCMLFDPKYAARIRGSKPMPELGRRERELLREVDPRALKTDDLRRARALHVILDEYPVSAVVLGVDWIDRFFESEPFRACVFGRGSMAVEFGAGYLRHHAKGVGVIEAGLADARRERPMPTARFPERGPASGQQLRRAPGVVPLTVPADTLAWYQRERERLGFEPVERLAKQRGPSTRQPPQRGEQHLLIEPGADGSFGIGSASAALIGLLRVASPAVPREALAAAAVELGAEPHEADEVLDDLLQSGLLCVSA